MIEGKRGQARFGCSHFNWLFDQFCRGPWQRFSIAELEFYSGKEIHPAEVCCCQQQRKNRPCGVLCASNRLNCLITS